MPKRPTTFLSDRTKAPAREPAFLVGVDLHSEPDSWSLASSLDELEALADTAGLAVVGRTTQQLGTPHGGTLIGSGKVEETKLAAHDAGAEVVLFDHELTPRQQRNLENALELKVIDRTALILDVFAQHARTREGMLQVELAQYEYRLPRLTRMWTHLARQSGGRAGGATGGVGVRGPGETQLEIDRREIGRRITSLKDEIESLRQQRRQTRQRRRRAGLPVVALVGYTNAGKSTLLNALTGAGVLAADQLFATLDPTTRRVALPSGRPALFTDTVGFIQKLPTQLVAAFRATLEEIAEADLLVHVVDVTHPDVIRQIQTVERVLRELGMTDPPMVVAANKVDRLPPGGEEGAGEARAVDGVAGRRGGDAAPLPAHPVFDVLAELRVAAYPDLVPISARQKAGLDDLLDAIDAALEQQLVPVTLVLPYQAGKVLDLVHTHGVVDLEVHGEAGTRLKARVPAYLLGEIEAYVQPGA
ncbi:GTPase HflX [bacterium]|nr:GTPase HflX [Chloroflexi bacterium CFX6]RIL11093.1 MAG: GTPase HflX [bacterium]